MTTIIEPNFIWRLTDPDPIKPMFKHAEISNRARDGRTIHTRAWARFRGMLTCPLGAVKSEKSVFELNQFCFETVKRGGHEVFLCRLFKFVQASKSDICFF